MFNSMRPEIPTWCQPKLNATGSSRLVKQWEHSSELLGDYVEN